MTKIISSLVLMLLLTGCISNETKERIKEEKPQLSAVNINYYANKSVTSLEVPPDLTSPSYENSFRLSELSSSIQENTINLTNKNIDSNQIISNKINDIVVKRHGSRRWLLIDKDPDLVWNLSKQFLKEKGFVIKKSNKKIGIMETDYLENKPKIPAQSLGLFRSFFAENIQNVSYTLPSIDKYKIRVEPVNQGKKTELYLSLSSMQEVITGSGSNESSLWQYKEKDTALENEMLLALMVFLGSDRVKAREDVLNAKEEGKIKVNIEEGINGYAKLVFDLNITSTWDNLAWAISETQFELEDKDINEKAFYINAARSEDKGFLSSIFGDDAIRQYFQIRLKTISESRTEVYFTDVSEKNEGATKRFSFEVFNKIKNLF